MWQETLLLLLVALALSLLVKSFVGQAFYIPSGSMEPGLVLNDRILVQKVSYWTSEPARGDVVVFEDPGGWLNGEQTQASLSPLARGLSLVGLYPTGGHLVKRVIGVAGDTIVCCDEQGRISVNGEPLDEEYLEHDAACNAPMGGCRWTVGPVPQDTLFVLGDHRDSSADSRAHLCPTEQCQDPGAGFVAVDLVVGKLLARVWPAKRFSVPSRPATFEDVPAP